MALLFEDPLELVEYRRRAGDKLAPREPTGLPEWVIDFGGQGALEELECGATKGRLSLLVGH